MPENYFFDNNKLLPWIMVSAYRAKIIPCKNKELENPAYIESFNSRKLDDDIQDDPDRVTSFASGNRDFGRCRVSIHEEDWD